MYVKIAIFILLFYFYFILLFKKSRYTGRTDFTFPRQYIEIKIGKWDVAMNTHIFTINDSVVCSFSGKLKLR